MEMLDLLGEKNSDVKKAIQFLLNVNIEESESYKNKQHFTPVSENDPVRTSYCTQQEHAIDWFFSKTLWYKNMNKNAVGIDLSKLIRNIQCVPLIIYLAIASNTITEDNAEILIKEIVKRVKQSSGLNQKNVRFMEKKELLNLLDNAHEKEWSNTIAQRLIE